MITCTCWHSNAVSIMSRRPNHWFLRGCLTPETYSSRGSRALREITDHLLLHPDQVNSSSYRQQRVMTCELTNPVHVFLLREAAKSISVSEIVWEGNWTAASLSPCSCHPPVSHLTCLSRVVILTIRSRLSDTTWDNRVICSCSRSESPFLQPMTLYSLHTPDTILSAFVMY